MVLSGQDDSHEFKAYKDFAPQHSVKWLKNSAFNLMCGKSIATAYRYFVASSENKNGNQHRKIDNMQ